MKTLVNSFCSIANIENISSESLKKWEEALSVAEKKRLSKISSLKRQREFILGRALIKKQCAVYFEKKMTEIEIGVHKNGSLFLPQEKGYYISLSHSKKYIVFVLANEAIGVDIQEIQNKSVNHLMKRIFPTEIPNDWNQKSGIEKQTFFYRLWTHKEAAFKLQSLEEQKKNIFFHDIIELTKYAITIASYNEIKSDIKFIDLN